jgi:large subunit ribosomal protein L21
MEAVIRTGGKQYEVSPGKVLRVEKLTAGVGETVRLGQVLLVKDGDNLHLDPGTLAGAQVTARVTAQGRGRKIVLFKYKRRKNYRRKLGHRQMFTELTIENIQLS